MNAPFSAPFYGIRVSHSPSPPARPALVFVFYLSLSLYYQVVSVNEYQRRVDALNSEDLRSLCKRLQVPWPVVSDVPPLSSDHCDPLQPPAFSPCQRLSPRNTRSLLVLHPIVIEAHNASHKLATKAFLVFYQLITENLFKPFKCGGFHVTRSLILLCQAFVLGHIFSDTAD